MLKKNLKLLKLLDEIEIEETNHNYKIRLKDVDDDFKHHVVVFIYKSDDSVEYCLSETGDCYEAFMSIPMDELEKLQIVVKELTK